MKLYIKPVGPIGTNCYIVADDNNIAVIIDPGAQAEKLMEFIKKMQLKPEYILLTHGHYDHIGGVKWLIEDYGCKLVIGEKDAEQLADREKSLATMRGMTPDIYILHPDILVKEGDVLTAGELSFEVIDTPGHTKGGVTYRCGGLLFTGDTLFAGDIGRTDLYGGDYHTLLASVKKLAELPGDYRVLPGHGSDSTLDMERKLNPYIRKPKHDDFY
ncbi:MBL fold metallo-hydrolase [Youxingia wuxianensis]|uniref:MBL fold metallo-hydrolase n=1 Tax=Youxingia wuxianensis TaxID=2763678 RepID=A0A926IHC7_9FIRM|nr:MBL fold metallo-hydrolase [Youxingia wuxianensis]MBC8585000.1 MBL fold metallo-hydrolase [Youxingia wuxianensis]